MAEGTSGAPDRARLAVFNHAISALAILLVAGAVAWAFNLFRMAGLVLFTEQFVASMLALSLLIVFLTVPARKSEREVKDRLPLWYDVVAALAGFAAAGYIAVRFQAIGDMMYATPVDAVTAATVIIVLTLEAIRRTVGWPLVITILVFVVYALVGHLIPGTLQARRTDFPNLAFYLAFDSSGVLGLPLIVACTIVVAFILFGNVLMATGGSTFFTDLALAAMGRYRGGSAKIAVTGSALFGTISGSAVANVMSIGTITIPMMRKAGYPAHQAAAVEAVASTGGGLMPPVMGAAAFVMAELLQVPYADVIRVAAVPAILYYAVLFIVADLHAARGGISRVEASLIPRLFSVLRSGWYFAVPFVVLIYTLFWLNERPDEAALFSAGSLIACALVFGFRGHRPSLREIVLTVRNTGMASLDMIMICAGAGIVIGILSISGVGFGLTLSLVSVASSSLILLLVLTALISIVLGMGMPSVAVYILLATLLAPAMEKAGVLPVAAHLFVLYFGMMSFITPPVAIAAFAAASVARADLFLTGFTAMQFGWVAYIVPFLFVYSPTLILIGSPGAILLDILTACTGIWFISAGVVGYALHALTRLERMAFVAAGAMLLLPAGLFDHALYLNIIGLAGAALLTAREIVLRARRGSRSATKAAAS